MYISMIELMKKAREGHYCVPAIAVENEHSVRAAIQAVLRLNRQTFAFARTWPQIWFLMKRAVF